MTPFVLETANQKAVDVFLKEKQLKGHLAHEINSEKNILVEELKAMLHLASYRLESLQVYLIRQAEKLTLTAQNTLLKSLEEAKEEQLFVLVTPNRHLLLPTILSRCQIVNLEKPLAPVSGATPDPRSLALLKTLSASPAACLCLTDDLLKDKPVVILRQLISFLSQNNRRLPTIKRLQVLQLALVCLTDLEQNVNPALALDHFLLNSNEVIKMKPAHA